MYLPIVVLETIPGSEKDVKKKYPLVVFGQIGVTVSGQHETYVIKETCSKHAHWMIKIEIRLNGTETLFLSLSPSHFSDQRRGSDKRERRNAAKSRAAEHSCELNFVHTWNHMDDSFVFASLLDDDLVWDLDANTSNKLKERERDEREQRRRARRCNTIPSR